MNGDNGVQLTGVESYPRQKMRVAAMKLAGVDPAVVLELENSHCALLCGYVVALKDGADHVPR